jgi:hypothetical protein
MPRLSTAIDALLRNVGFPLVIVSGVVLHCFTAIAAYRLAAPGWKAYGAALAAWIFPLISETLVAYYSWRASGSIVNTYSVWVLMWLVMVLSVWWLVELKIGRERAQGHSVPRLRRWTSRN